MFEDGEAAGAGLGAYSTTRTNSSTVNPISSGSTGSPCLRSTSAMPPDLVRAAQVHREGGAQSALLAVGGGALRMEQVEGVVDLVAGAGGGPGVAGDGHRDAGEDQRLGQHLEEAVVVDAARRVTEHGLAGLPGHGGGESVDLLAVDAVGLSQSATAEMLETTSPMPERTHRTGPRG
ncbi:hypothetical protein STENM223S_09749 [Streptomyces tendae]